MGAVIVLKAENSANATRDDLHNDMVGEERLTDAATHSRWRTMVG